MAFAQRNETRAKMPPKLDDEAKSVRFNMIVPDTWLERVDEWRRKHPSIPNRSEAIRLLVEQALSHPKP